MPGRRLRARPLIAWTALALAVPLAACNLPWALPSLDLQKQQVRDHRLTIRQLTPQAFLEVWGAPVYEYEATTQFFPVESGQYVPRFRVPTGEAPTGWEGGIASGPGRFFIYPQRGELLGFLDDKLVYREPLSEPELHALGKAWAFERQFRSTIEDPGGKSR